MASSLCLARAAVTHRLTIGEQPLIDDVSVLQQLRLVEVDVHAGHPESGTTIEVAEERGDEDSRDCGTSATGSVRAESTNARRRNARSGR